MTNKTNTEIAKDETIDKSLQIAKDETIGKSLQIETVEKEKNELQKEIKEKNNDIQKLSQENKEFKEKINEFAELIKTYDENWMNVDIDDILSFQEKYYKAKEKLDEIKRRYQIEIPDVVVVKRPTFKTKLVELQYDYRNLLREKTKPWFWWQVRLKNIEKEIIKLKVK